MRSHNALTLPEVEEISFERGREMLRMEVSDKLGIPLDRFFAKVDAGDYAATEDDSVHRLLMLLPYAR